MARFARIVVPGLSHHTVHRAKPRVPLFRDQADYTRYRELLRQNCVKYDVDIVAFCIMPDHVHAILVPRSARGLSRAVGETGRLYARHRGLGGTQLWQGRFHSCPLDEEHAKAAIAYVLANPERARLGAWPWVFPDTVPSSATPQQIDMIRKSTNTGRPGGSAEFYARLEYDLGRPLAPRKRGRQAKW